MRSVRAEQICDGTARATSARTATLALAVYYLSTLLVAAGVWFGHDFLPRREYRDFPGFAIEQPPKSLLGCFGNWDGVWYRDIADHGYTYNPAEGSHVVFFPGYPAVAATVGKITGLAGLLPLLIISHGCFFLCLWLLQRYVQLRFPDAPEEVAACTLLVIAFSPMSFFFRMAYSESLFCLLVLLALYGVLRRWPVWVVAAISGSATAVRLAGVALLPVILLYLWDRTASDNAWSNGRTPRLLAWLALPLAMWGIVAYIAYLDYAFDDPWAFHRNHAHFNDRARMADPVARRIGKLLTLEPIWSVYVPGSPRYWAASAPRINPLFNLRFLNPIFFVFTALIVAWGCWRRRLNRYETVVSVLLLAIPYVSKGYDNAMQGHARYALAVVPAFWVVGGVLAEMPSALRFCLLAMSAALMTLYSALFAAWYVVI